MLRGKAAVSQEYPLSFHWEILFNGLDRVVTSLRNFKLTVCPIREDSFVYPAALSQHVGTCLLLYRDRTDHCTWPCIILHKHTYSIQASHSSMTSFQPAIDCKTSGKHLHINYMFPQLTDDQYTATNGMFPYSIKY